MMRTSRQLLRLRPSWQGHEIFSKELYFMQADFMAFISNALANAPNRAIIKLPSLSPQSPKNKGRFIFSRLK